MVFLRDAFSLLHHLRPVMWRFSASQDPLGIASFDQYEHLALLEKQLAQNAELAAAWGGGYLVTPDITVSRESCGDEEINAYQPVVDEGESVARLTPLRRANRASPRPMLQASISRKWTIRSDRSQNTRTEALNLIRSRKGHTPHIVAVTAEPLPTRIASLALGTGDIDCVYHMALPELELAIADCENADQGDMLRTMVQGRRLRDISDLPFDLAI
jgi:antitoxin (DNA-binding transcriptional repressor) of toxin-antitoxin stability system